MCPVNTPLTFGRHDCSIHFHFCLQGDCTLHPNSPCLCLFQAKKKDFHGQRINASLGLPSIRFEQQRMQFVGGHSHHGVEGPVELCDADQAHDILYAVRTCFVHG